jgi:hypothetical protein
MPNEKNWEKYLPEGLNVEFIAAVVGILVSHLHNGHRFTGRHFSLKLSRSQEIKLLIKKYA